MDGAQSHHSCHTRRHAGAARVGMSATVALLVSLTAVSCTTQPAPRSTSPGAPCTVEGLSARCGTLAVREDRPEGTGPTIPVRFVVIPASGPERAPDPVVYFAGGPGDSAVTQIPTELPMLSDLAAHRDLVFIEQRGTGRSNPLTCPLFPGLSGGAAPLRAQVTSCLDRLHGDLRYYTTAMYADDVDQVLSVLHYTKVDLVGISYGTAAAQVFLLRHPARVRTITMQSGSPLDVHVIERAPANSQRALDYVFARCRTDPSCHRAFPHLAAEWAQLWASVGRSPWLLPASRSPTGKSQRMDQDGLAAALYQAMYGFSENLIPIGVHTLATAKDKTAAMAALARIGQDNGTTPADGRTLMLPFAITCGEPWAGDRPAALADQRGSFTHHRDLDAARWWQVVCPVIPTSAAAVGDLRLTPSDIPILAFNGAGDPIEQPVNWAASRKAYPNSRDVVLPGQGHDVDVATWRSCAGVIDRVFIEQGGLAHLDTACTAELAQPFALSLP